ncbi:sensor histidine kinase [Phytomonospora endophytica]|uniref:histidine kinase n=1 Tax=Phytomonospora endophytica TaxID=714109 RepID=A0A841FBH2_9ACTN|nr:histidine kinase [Phytomonospora endophytica]MBB6032363.1 signal transduction histidine kinase [Phytomonospora endophytica]GIG68711.1 two-component sensor histidine kinase [Phytomonospora endophytica]
MTRPPRRDLLVSALLAALLGGPSVAMLVVAGPGPWRSGAAGVALAVAHAAMPWRRVRPLPSFAVVTAAFAGLAASTGMFVTLPSALLFPFALYSACAYGGRVVSLTALLIVLAGAAGGTLRLSSDPATAASGALPRAGVVFVALAAMLLAAWSLGLWRRAQLAWAEQRALAAAAAERARIAGEMHDVVAHSLAVIISQANGGRYAAESEPDTAVEVLGTIAKTAKAALADTRGLLGVLDPDPGSVSRAPQPTLGELPALLDRVRSAGLAVESTSRGTPRGLTPAAELALYRLAQEALTNTLRHAPHSSASTLHLEWGGEALEVHLTDTATGRPPPMARTEIAPIVEGPGPLSRVLARIRLRSPSPAVDPVASTGRGLRGMDARFSALGGTVEAGPHGAGFRVRARLPYGGAS